MNEATWLIVLHQLLFQGMFFMKNMRLQRRLDQPIRGANREANLAIIVLMIFIGCALYLAAAGEQAPGAAYFSPGVARTVGLLLMAASLLMAWASLRDLGDSWRVGVIEEQQTQLIEQGVYRFSRNPFFVAYLLTFAAYTVLLQNLFLLLLFATCFVAIHGMILREEKYLADSHGAAYQAYKQRVPRYLGF